MNKHNADNVARTSKRLIIGWTIFIVLYCAADIGATLCSGN